MRVVTVGEALGVLRSSGRITTESTLAIGIGGAELNVAVGLRRLGVATTWVGRLGSDGIGQRIRRELRGEDVDLVVVDDPHPTGLLLKERDGLGRTLVTYHRAGSAGSRLEPHDLDRVPWAAVDLVHVTGITPALSESASATVDRAVALAREHGAGVSFDVNHRASLWGGRDATATYRRLAESADVVFAGVDEAALLLADGVADTAVGASEAATDASDPTADPTALAVAVANRFGVEAVVKRGADGAVTALAGDVWHRAAMPTAVVDTVGAGDAFVAGYLAEQLAGAPIDRRLSTAVTAGAAACRHPGDWENALTRDEAGAVVGDPVVR